MRTLFMMVVLAVAISVCDELRVRGRSGLAYVAFFGVVTVLPLGAWLFKRRLYSGLPDNSMVPLRYRCEGCKTEHLGLVTLVSLSEQPLKPISLCQKCERAYRALGYTDAPYEGGYDGW